MALLSVVRRHRAEGSRPAQSQPLSQGLGLGRRSAGAPRTSSDMARILALPRRAPLDLREDDSRKPVDPAVRELVARWSTRLRQPKGTQSLFGVQAWALEEMAQCGGLLGAIGVGHGKTLLGCLAPMVLQARVAVLLIPPELRHQFFNHDWAFYGQHWRLPNLAGRGNTDGGRYYYPDRPILHVIAYSELSTAKNTDLLERIQPDLIIADEAQNLKDRGSSRTKRFLRYLAAHQATRFCGWSGTLTKRSLKDFAHLAIYALGNGAPVPHHWPAIEEWAGILDPWDEFDRYGRELPAPDPTPLRLLCQAMETEDPRAAFSRRFLQTPGVIHTAERSIDTPIIMRTQPVAAVPQVVREAHEVLRKKWERPDGEPFDTALKVAACARQIACGFYYRWRYPRGESRELIDRWFAARKAWKAELRDRLSRARPHMDSPLLCFEAARRYWAPGKQAGISGEYEGPLPVWAAETWREWNEVRDLVKHVPEAVWLDDFLAQNAAEWARQNVGIVWYEHDAFGRRVAELSGAPLYGPGKAASEGIAREDGSRTIVASVKAHGTGKNLQAFSKQLVANPPSDGGTWEQMLGRTHRKGQDAEEVLVLVYRHVEEMVRAVDRAHALADYIEGMLQTSQRLPAAKHQ